MKNRQNTSQIQQKNKYRSLKNQVTCKTPLASNLQSEGGVSQI